MPVYIVTGKLGSGKSLCTVGRIQDYLNQDRHIATNLDLKLENLVNPFAKKTTVYRVPDRPTVDDLENLPRPYEGKYDEKKTGLIVLDECGTWFNTRNYRDKGRTELIDKLLHIRKAGWDVMFIIQHIEMMDKQVREGLGEHIVYCKRMDRLMIPFVGPLLKLFGLNVRPPRIHMAIVKYGAGEAAPVVDRWIYQGKDLYDAYETEQIFTSNSCQLNSVLPPNYVYGRYTNESKHNVRRFKGAAAGFLEAASTRAFFLIGLAVGVLSLWGYEKLNSEPIKNVKASEQKVEKVKEPLEHELNGVWISASVKSSDGFDYVFYSGTDEEPISFYPKQLGYRVRWVSSCKASLVKDKIFTTITCYPYIPKA